MKKTKEFYEQIKKHKIPDNDIEILKYLIKEDRNEYFNILRQFVCSQIHVDNHLNNIIEDIYWFKQTYPGPTTIEVEFDVQKAVLEDLVKNKFEKWEEIITFIERYYEPDKFSINNERISPKRDFILYLWKYVYDEKELLDLKRKQENLEAHLKRKKKKEKVTVPLDDNLALINKKQNWFQRFAYNHSLRKEIRSLKKEITEIENMHIQEEKMREELIKELETEKECYKSRYAKRIMEKYQEFTENGETIESICNSLAISLKYDYIHEINLCEYKFENMKKLIEDIKSNIEIFQQIYSPDIMKGESLQILCRNIRRILVNSNVDSDREITEEYRNIKLKKNNEFIKGANLSKEEIEIEMENLEEEYKKAEECQDIEEYVRRCADLHLKFLEIHPYSDGNGRTSRILLTIMLAKRDIIMPSVFDTYYDRYRDGSREGYMSVTDKAVIYEDYEVFQDYLIKRVQKFNSGIINLATIESIRNMSEQVNVKDKLALTPIIISSQSEHTNSRTVQREGDLRNE